MSESCSFSFSGCSGKDSSVPVIVAACSSKSSCAPCGPPPSRTVRAVEFESCSSSGDPCSYLSAETVSSLPSDAILVGGCQQSCGQGNCGQQNCGQKCGHNCATNGSCPGGPPCYYPRSGRYNPGDDAIGFRAFITPVQNLSPVSGGCSLVQFWMRRKNSVVTLQWETFRGNLGVNGIAYLCVNQTLCNLPPCDVSFPIRLILRGKAHIGYLFVGGYGSCSAEQIRFYLSLGGSGEKNCRDDCFEIPGSSVSWITV